VTDSLALLRGLRRTRGEAQLTKVIASVAESDSRFAGAFAEMLVGAARERANAANAKKLEPVPDELKCRAEWSLYDFDDDDSRLGRVDLRFDTDDFVLFVENKLYSGYGHDQLERYVQALDLLPDYKSRRGLVAVTRDIPGYGEPDANECPQWLGSLRWIDLIDELRGLPIVDDDVRRQWQLLVELLKQQGDLGEKTVDKELLKGWGRFYAGRELAVRLLMEVQGTAEQCLREALQKRYPDQGDDDLVAGYRRGKNQTVTVVKGATANWLGWRVPASVEYASVILQFMNKFGVAHFSVEAWPYASLERRQSPSFKKAAQALDRAEYAIDPKGRYLSHLYEPKDYLETDDTLAELARIAREDITAIVESGLFDYDFAEGP